MIRLVPEKMKCQCFGHRGTLAQSILTIHLAPAKWSLTFFQVVNLLPTCGELFFVFFLRSPMSQKILTVTTLPALVPLLRVICVC